MAAEIQKEFGLGAEFVAGSGGIFEVHLDGEIVFTNRRMDGVPEPHPVVEAIRYALGGDRE